MSYTDKQLAGLEGAMLATYERELGFVLTDPARLADLYGSQFFDADVALKLNSICATACQLLETPSSEVNLVTKDQQITVASFGHRGLHRVELSSSLCQHVVGSAGPLVVGNALSHNLVCRSNVTVDGGVRAYLGVPLISARGYVLGSLCTWMFSERVWTPTEVSMLASLASVVMRFESNL